MFAIASSLKMSVCPPHRASVNTLAPRTSSSSKPRSILKARNSVQSLLNRRGTSLCDAQASPGTSSDDACSFAPSRAGSIRSRNSRISLAAGGSGSSANSRMSTGSRLSKATTRSRVTISKKVVFRHVSVDDSDSKNKHEVGTGPGKSKTRSKAQASGNNTNSGKSKKPIKLPKSFQRIPNGSGDQKKASIKKSKSILRGEAVTEGEFNMADEKYGSSSSESDAESERSKVSTMSRNSKLLIIKNQITLSTQGIQSSTGSTTSDEMEDGLLVGRFSAFSNDTGKFARRTSLGTTARDSILAHSVKNSTRDGAENRSNRRISSKQAASHIQCQGRGSKKKHLARNLFSH